MPSHISYVQFKQHPCACHTCTECEPECSRLCVCSTASAGRYCYVLRNSWLLTTVRKMQRVGEQLQSHNHTDQTYVTREPHIIIHLRYTPLTPTSGTALHTHQHSNQHTNQYTSVHKPVHISTHQHTSAHIIILSVHISTQISTHQYTSVQISTHQYTSLSYQYTNTYTRT